MTRTPRSGRSASKTGLPVGQLTSRVPRGFTKADNNPRVVGVAKRMEHHDLLSGLVRLHVLHHAAEEPIYGQWMIDELARHGYRLSPGTLYPMLAKMERDGYLTCHAEREGRTSRKLYSITEKGRAGLAVARMRLRELVREAGQG